MRDEKKWALAWVRFDALRRNIPRSISKDRVDEYHSILEALHAATGEDLSPFRIPDGELKPLVVAMRYGTRRHPGSVSYSDEKYCDVAFFARQIEGVSSYIAALETPKQNGAQAEEQIDYWAMSECGA